MIEDDFTRPRTRDLEQLDDDDDDDEGEEDHHFQGFSGDEEREFVRRWGLFFVARLTGIRRTSTRATSRHSTRCTRPTQENVKPLRTSFSPSSRAALVRPLSYAALIDVRLSSLNNPCMLSTPLRLCGTSTSPAQIFSLRPVGLAWAPAR